MKERVEHKEIFNAKPSVIYHAWLDSDEHSKMTGGEAECSDEVGGSFTAWDGYISGTNIVLQQDEEIIQKWRTLEFDDEDEDSELIIRFEEVEEGCELTLVHRNIPEGQTQYEQGWIDSYFVPMRSYFKKLH